MVSGVSVAWYVWLGLEMIEPKTDGTWNHDNIMQNVHKVLALTGLKHSSLDVNCS